MPHRRKYGKTVLRVVFFLLLLINGAGLVHRDASAATVGPPAVSVYGQGGSFTANLPGTSSSTFSSVKRVALDGRGGFYESESANNRVLYVPPGSTTATRVYGQGAPGSDFTSGTANLGGSITATTLDQPEGIALDSAGNLYVADNVNNRVLYYPSSAGIAAVTPTRVYGQGPAGIVGSSFTTGTAGTSSSTISGPTALGLDSRNNLYVAEAGNNRVLFFPARAGGAGTAAFTATRVYGQGDFVSGAANRGSTLTASTLSHPVALALDRGDTLYIADRGNNRVLSYPPASGNGMAATRVYGQANVTSGFANRGGAISASTLSSPSGLAVEGNNGLYVADSLNHRVLYYPAYSADGMAATRVYGQAGSFTTGMLNAPSGKSATASATGLQEPAGLALDSGGNLYVADAGNNRILKFQASARVTGQSAQAAQAAPPPASRGPRATLGKAPAHAKGTGHTARGSRPRMSSIRSRALATATLPTPTGYWPFDAVSGGSPNTTADSSGNGNTGTLTSSGVSLAIPGELNNGLAFTGSGSSVSMGTPATLKFGAGSFTVMFWFKATAMTSGGHRMVSYGQYNWIPGYFIGVNSNSNCTSGGGGCIGGGVGPATAGPTHQSEALSFNTHSPFIDNVWHQVAMVIDRGGTVQTAQIYIDGTAQIVDTGSGTCGTGTGTTTITISPSTTNCKISASPSAENFTVGSHNGTDENFPGSLDEVRVYGSALSSTDILSQYTNDTIGGYWPLDAVSGGSPNTTADSSSNGNTGILTGGQASLTTSGEVNSALLFPTASTSYVTMGATQSTLKFGLNSFTVMAWFKTTASAMERMVGEGVTAFSAGFNLSVSLNGTCSAGGVGAELGGGSFGASVTFCTTATTFKDGNWHQAVLVIDRSGTVKTAKLYVDGQPQNVTELASTCTTGTGVSSIVITGCVSANATSADAFTLGANKPSGAVTAPFIGSLDEVRVYRSALNSTQILSQYTADATPPTATGYWPLDAIIAGTPPTTADLAGTNPGSITGGASLTNGKVNDALFFDGSGSVSMGTNRSGLQFASGSFTIINWFNTTDTAGHNRIVSEGDYGYTAGYFTSIGPDVSNCPSCAGGVGGSVGGISGANSLLFYTTTNYNDGNWHQEAMVIDRAATTAQIYIDGVAKIVTTGLNTCGTGSGTTTINFSACNASLNATSTTESFNIGSHSGSTEKFNGSIDEVSIYGSALSLPQIQTQYTSDLNGLSESATATSFTVAVGGTVSYSLPITVSYLLTPAPGWSLTITSTTFTSGGNTLPTNASTIAALTTASCVSTCTQALNNAIIAFPLTIPAAATAPTAVPLFSAVAGSGTGVYTVTPSISVKIPASARTGAYTSTITLTAASGP